MARPRITPRKIVGVESGTIDELTRIVALAFRYAAIPQGVLVHDLTDAGLPVGRIATLLNTSSNTVSQQKRTKRPDWPKNEGRNAR